MKKISIYAGIGLVVVVLAIVITVRIYAKSCNCVDKEAVMSECYVGEYVSSVVKNSNCDYNACEATVEVTCRDKRDGKTYTHTVNTFVIGCKDCTEGGGGSSLGEWDEIWWTPGGFY